MTISNYAVRPYGFGLPKFSQTDKVQRVVGLDTQQQDRWIRHPQVMTQSGKFAPIPSSLAPCWGSICIRGYGSGTKRLDRKAPARVLTGARLEVARSTLAEKSVRGCL